MSILKLCEQEWLGLAPTTWSSSEGPPYPKQTYFSLICWLSYKVLTFPTEYVRKYVTGLFDETLTAHNHIIWENF